MSELNLSAICDQKATPGYVEIPACERLRALAAEVPADRAIVELGAFGGRSTGWLGLGVSEGNGAPIVSIDCWDLRRPGDWPSHAPGYVKRYSDPEVEASYRAHLETTGVRPLVETIKGFSLDVVKTWKAEGRPKIGMLWHDAAHEYDEVVADLRAWLPLLAKDAVVCLHDAGNPRYGVFDAARDVFSKRKTWDWEGHELHRWPKSPNRRGLLIVRTKGA